MRNTTKLFYGCAQPGHQGITESQGLRVQGFRVSGLGVWGLLVVFLYRTCFVGVNKGLQDVGTSLVVIACVYLLNSAFGVWGFAVN